MSAAHMIYEWIFIRYYQNIFMYAPRVTLFVTYAMEPEYVQRCTIKELEILKEIKENYHKAILYTNAGVLSFMAQRIVRGYRITNITKDRIDSAKPRKEMPLN